MRLRHDRDRPRDDGISRCTLCDLFLPSNWWNEKGHIMDGDFAHYAYTNWKRGKYARKA